MEIFGFAPGLRTGRRILDTKINTYRCYYHDRSLMMARRVYETAEEASTELAVESDPRRRRERMGKEDERKLEAFGFLVFD